MCLFRHQYSNTTISFTNKHLLINTEYFPNDELINALIFGRSGNNEAYTLTAS